MKPIRLVVSLFFIGVFLIIWFSLKNGEGFTLYTFISVTVILFLIFIIISFATEFKQKPNDNRQKQEKKGLPHTNGFYQRKMDKLRRQQPVLSKIFFYVDYERRIRQKNGIISDNIDDYIIEASDRERDNDYDPNYKQKYREVLFHLYDNLCPLCRENQCEHLDHFFIPKCKGGNFIMVTKEGDFVNNAVPLCSKCNLKKSKNSYKDFFTPEQLEYVSHRNAIMTAVLRKRF